MRLAGSLDGNEGWTLTGWAADETRDGQPVAVELATASGWRRVVLADQLRPDLVPQWGDGRHGFSCRLPTQMLPEGDTVTVRIAGTDFVLVGSPFPVRPGPPLEIVAGDIVNNCNLRCPFCLTDYQNTRGLRRMPDETYERSLRLLPLVRDGGFWLSCMHEPLLHPRFAEFLRAIPAAWRRKVSFTTNLARRVGRGVLEAMAGSGIESIRVSIDSRDPALFERLRQGARFPLFEENLQRFAALLRVSEHPPRLDIISMAFRDNLQELPALVRYCREELGAGAHEIRYMYYLPHVADWGAAHVPTLDEWGQLKDAIAAASSGQRVAFSEPAANAEASFRERRGVAEYEPQPAVFGGDVTERTYTPADPLKSGYPVPDADLHVRMRWDGLLMIEELPEWEFRANVLHLEDPETYFRALRRAGCPPGTTESAGWTRTP